MNAKTEAKAEIQIKNLTYVKAIEGKHDLKITGVPSGDVQLETTQEVQLGVETDVEYTWSANNDAVATIDQTGKLTIVGSGKVTVTVTPTDAMYAGLASSVTISVISEWDEPTAWHLDTTAAEWQGNTGDEFAKSWKVTGKDVTVAAAGKAAANADYIFLDLYLSKSNGFTYH
ncbi:MAG: Ig-like domain-containing protein [Christensenellales bacterium]